MRKRGITSPLDLLPLHQKQALAGWLCTGGKGGAGISYGEAVKRLHEEFGVKTCETALCTWRARSQRAAGIPENKLSRKIVIRSPLDLQPVEVRNTLYAWLTTGGTNGLGMSFDQAAVRLRAEFGIKSCATAIFNFFKRYQRHLRAQAPGVARITTTEAGGIKTITLETATNATVETIQDAGAQTFTLKITLPK